MGICAMCAFLLLGCGKKDMDSLQPTTETEYVLETEKETEESSAESSVSPSEQSEKEEQSQEKTTASVPVTEMKKPETQETETTENTELVSDEQVDSELYTLATNIPKAEVEQYAKQVKQQFLDRDWKALSEKFTYPITIGGTVYENPDEFLAADFEADLNPYFFVELEEESCENMFCNWSGIMMGETGRVWIVEALNEDFTSNGLRIRAVNGLTESFGLPGGVSMRADESDITPTSMKLKLKNETDLNIIFSDDYKLQKFEDGIWKDLDMLPGEMVFHDIAYMPERGKPVEWNVDWSSRYGSLEPGNYMIVKVVIDGDVKGEEGKYQRAFNFLIGG